MPPVLPRDVKIFAEKISFCIDMSRLLWYKHFSCETRGEEKRLFEKSRGQQKKRS